MNLLGSKNKRNISGNKTILVFFCIVGPGGLVRGDVITGIEDCPVRDLDSWLTCLENIWEADPVGYCVQNEIVSRLSNNSEGNNTSFANFSKTTFF